MRDEFLGPERAGENCSTIRTIPVPRQGTNTFLFLSPRAALAFARLPWAGFRGPFGANCSRLAANIRVSEQIHTIFAWPVRLDRGLHVLVGDGTVRFVNFMVAPEIWKGLLTRAGGETIEDF